MTISSLDFLHYFNKLGLVMVSDNHALQIIGATNVSDAHALQIIGAANVSDAHALFMLYKLLYYDLLSFWIR